MSKDEKSKESNEPDLMTDLLRQMGLCEEEIGAALDLAESIEQKIETKGKTGVTPSKIDLEKLPVDELIKLIEEKDSQLNHFQNVVAVQLVLIIQKYKDRVISLENKLQQKNAQIEKLSKKLDLMRR